MKKEGDWKSFHTVCVINGLLSTVSLLGAKQQRYVSVYRVSRDLICKAESRKHVCKEEECCNSVDVLSRTGVFGFYIGCIKSTRLLSEMKLPVWGC